MKFKKSKNMPRAFSEAKVTMALYKKWNSIYQVDDDPFHQNPNTRI
jgi:hypothetical protein